jgi:hypothetical protein
MFHLDLLADCSSSIRGNSSQGWQGAAQQQRHAGWQHIANVASGIIMKGLHLSLLVDCSSSKGRNNLPGCGQMRQQQQCSSSAGCQHVMTPCWYLSVLLECSASSRGSSNSG